MLDTAYNDDVCWPRNLAIRKLVTKFSMRRFHSCWSQKEDTRWILNKRSNMIADLLTPGTGDGASSRRCPQRLWMLSGTAPAVMSVHIGALCMGSAAQRYRWWLVSAPGGGCMAPVVTPRSGLRRSRNRDTLLSNVWHKGRKKCSSYGGSYGKF